MAVKNWTHNSRTASRRVRPLCSREGRKRKGRGTRHKGEDQQQQRSYSITTHRPHHTTTAAHSSPATTTPTTTHVTHRAGPLSEPFGGP